MRLISLRENRDIPGGPVVKNLPANIRDMGFIPGLGRYPHAVRQLSPRTTASKAHVPWSLNSATREATARRNPRTTTREEPLLTQLEKACVQLQRPSAAENNKENVH